MAWLEGPEIAARPTCTASAGSQLYHDVVAGSHATDVTTQRIGRRVQWQGNSQFRTWPYGPRLLRSGHRSCRCAGCCASAHRPLARRLRNCGRGWRPQPYSWGCSASLRRYFTFHCAELVILGRSRHCSRGSSCMWSCSCPTGPLICCRNDGLQSSAATHQVIRRNNSRSRSPRCGLTISTKATRPSKCAAKSWCPSRFWLAGPWRTQLVRIAFNRS